MTTKHRIRRFEAGDQDAMLAFAGTLPEHDLMFLGRDLRHARVVAAWLNAINEGWIDSLVAIDGEGALLGTAALVRDPLSWSSHVGEVRLLVDGKRRGAGLGRDLLEALFAIAAQHGLTKLSARMTPDQAGSVALFESLGFRGEALLKGEVKDAQGKVHDLVILSLDIERAQARGAALGLDDGA